MVPSNDGQFCLYQHLVYVVKLASKGYIFFFYIILLEVADLAIWLIQILITATPSR